MTQDPKVDEIIKCVTSSNLAKLGELMKGEIPVVEQFPLCGKWRKRITLMHLAAAYGSLTCIQYLIGKIDINSQTEDGVCFVLIGRRLHVLLRIGIKVLLRFYWRTKQTQQFATKKFVLCSSSKCSTSRCD